MFHNKKHRTLLFEIKTRNLNGRERRYYLRAPSGFKSFSSPGCIINGAFNCGIPLQTCHFWRIHLQNYASKSYDAYLNPYLYFYQKRKWSSQMMEVNRSSNSSIAETAFSNVGYQFILFNSWTYTYLYIFPIFISALFLPRMCFLSCSFQGGWDDPIRFEQQQWGYSPNQGARIGVRSNFGVHWKNVEREKTNDGSRCSLKPMIRDAIQINI